MSKSPMQDRSKEDSTQAHPFPWDNPQGIEGIKAKEIQKFQDREGQAENNTALERTRESIIPARHSRGAAVHRRPAASS